jgi:hypothetical protein
LIVGTGVTLEPKGKSEVERRNLSSQQTDEHSGVKTDPKVFPLAGPWNRISPTGSPCGVENRKVDNGLEGIGTWKKLTLVCNGRDRS